MITDPRLLKVLENRRQSEEINHIITTIRANQYEMITFDRHKNVLVLGCAGSGKTMIMLQRLPIVLMDNPLILQKNNIYIIYKHEYFQND